MDHKQPEPLTEREALILAGLDFVSGCQCLEVITGNVCSRPSSMRWMCRGCGFTVTLCQTHDTLQFMLYEAQVRGRRFKCYGCGNVTDESWRNVWARVTI